MILSKRERKCIKLDVNISKRNGTEMERMLFEKHFNNDDGNKI